MKFSLAIYDNMYIVTNIYRIFCCFDEGNLVILFNAFQKKSQKTPSSEIKRALRIKDEYFSAKADIMVLIKNLLSKKRKL